MKTRADVAAARYLASFLTFFALRDAIALILVWLRPGLFKMIAVNRFRSDYPLYFHLFVQRNLVTPECQHKVCVATIEAECLCWFCFDLVASAWSRVEVRTMATPRGFVRVLRRSSRASLAIAALHASCPTVVRNLCLLLLFSRIQLASNDDVLSG
jgi:hypothetical protein